MNYLTAGASFIAFAFYETSPASLAPGMRVFHQIEITLIPEENKLAAADTMDVEAGGQKELRFRLSERMTGVTVYLGDSKAEFEFRSGLLRIPIEGQRRGGDIRVKIEYQGVFNDPVPIRPINTDNPGYGVLGSISPRGTMLLSGAEWYPELQGAAATYLLTVDAPEGIVAVSAGRSLEGNIRDGRTVSRWQVDYPVKGLALAAARYAVEKRIVNGVTTATYFLSENRNLSEGYLTATARYLKLYSDLFGPYPFHKFAVVENFFPTGYGFPSFTLLGSSVLRLPFITHTSLGHEIAHCWWGNGVYVDPDGGNWSEGITTYVADYLYKERESDASAQAYRTQMLRNYATLVNGLEDFPLARFTSRTDPVTKTIGYDKSAMVFHMIRRRIGDAAFWSALRSLYAEQLFQTVSWKDFQRVFEREGKISLDTFFRQWVFGKGAPQLALAEVGMSIKDGSHMISGKILQEGSLFNLRVPIVLETVTNPLRQVLSVTGAETPFTLRTEAFPRRLVIDPDADLMRRLFPEEIPPSVNSLKGSERLLVVLSEGIPPEAAVTAEILARSLGLKEHRMVAESAVTPEMLKQDDLLVVGYPASGRLPVRLPPGVSLDKDRISLYETVYTDDSITFFGVFNHPYADGRVAALLLPLSNRYSKEMVGKITHYGRYSYLLFRNGHVRAKETWPVTDSPTVYRWTDSEVEFEGDIPP